MEHDILFPMRTGQTIQRSDSNTGSAGYDAHNDTGPGYTIGTVSNVAGISYYPDFYLSYDFGGSDGFAFYGNNIGQQGCVNMGAAFSSLLDVNVPLSGFNGQRVGFTEGDYLVFKANSEDPDLPGEHTDYYVILHAVTATPPPGTGDYAVLVFDILYVYVEP
jgi:hypothetical protein